MPRDKYHNNPSSGLCVDCEHEDTMKGCDHCFRNFSLSDNFQRRKS